MAEGIYPIKREDDPNRCQAVKGSSGQCTNLGYIEGEYSSPYCLVHGGNKAIASQKKASLRNYKLDKFNAQLNRLGTSPNIKNLRDEIAILRMMLEERLNKCSDTNDLLLQSNIVADLIMKINQVVISCHKLENSMGQLMDKASVIQFASEIIGIITDVLEGQESAINEIATKILSRISKED